MVIGFPFNRFFPIVRGVYATLDPTEPDEKKREIEDNGCNLNRKTPTINYGRNYFTGLNPD